MIQDNESASDIENNFLTFMEDDVVIEYVSLKQDDGGKTLDVFVSKKDADNFRVYCPSMFQGVRTIVIET